MSLISAGSISLDSSFKYLNFIGVWFLPKLFVYFSNKRKIMHLSVILNILKRHEKHQILIVMMLSDFFDERIKCDATVKNLPM